MTNPFLEELPPYYKNIREFREMSNTVTASWDQLDEALFDMENDQFILTSSETAVAMREKDFGIRADLKSETLKFRKLRLLARMQDKAPYVLEYLIKVLTNLLGENKHQILLDINHFEMEVAIDVELTIYYKEVINIIERIVPLNIDLMATILAIKDSLVLIAGTYAWNFNNNRICGRFKTASKSAIIGKENISIQDGSYAFLFRARVCGRFRAGGVIV